MSIQLSRTERVLTITLQRPEKKNALSSQMYLDLTAALVQAQADEQYSCGAVAGSTGLFLCWE